MNVGLNLPNGYSRYIYSQNLIFFTFRRAGLIANGLESTTKGILQGVFGHHRGDVSETTGTQSLEACGNTVYNVQEREWRT